MPVCAGPMQQNAVLWRVAYERGASLQADGFKAGPWHPDRAFIERCAEGLRGLGQPAFVQSSQEFGANGIGGLERAQHRQRA